MSTQLWSLYQALEASIATSAQQVVALAQQIDISRTLAEQVRHLLPKPDAEQVREVLGEPSTGRGRHFMEKGAPADGGEKQEGQHQGSGTRTSTRRRAKS